jgi:hypothetical protein
MRLVVVTSAVLLLSACHHLPTWRTAPSSVVTTRVLARIPRDAARFEVDSVTDSTATFRVREATWVRPGMQSYMVDPAQRDALVARLRILSRSGESATAIVTGQVTSIKAEHFLLVVRPEVPWWSSRRFWMGTVVGATAAASGAMLLR